MISWAFLSMSVPPKRVSILLLCAVFGLCFYRAATQSFTIDESFTFLRYVNVGLWDSFWEYSANNHVLQTLTMRVCRKLLGRSELVMRLPTLLGCVLFLAASYQITLASFRRKWMQPIALAVMTLNPLILDFLVAARGYGLALGLSWWALYLAWRDLDSPSRWGLWLAGVCAGLAVTANLVFVIPLASMGLLLLPLYFRRRRFWEFIDAYAGPASVICFVFLLIPLLKSEGQFYFGVPTLQETFGSLVYESLPRSAEKISLACVPLVVVLSITAAWLWFVSIRGASSQITLLGLVLGTIACSVGFWIGTHHFFGVVYPLGRTALYVLPLAGFGFVLAGSIVPSRIACGAIASVAAVVAILYVGELRTNYFKEWRNEAGMKRLVRLLANDAAKWRQSKPVTAGGSWDLEYSLRYYGVRYRIGWLTVLNAEERKTVQPDYYLLGPEDRKTVSELGLRVIADDALSGTVLARRL